MFVVGTMPCLHDSKKKKVIDLSTLSRHSEPFSASWPSSRATFRLQRWHKHAALQLWARSGVKTQMLLCADRRRKRASGGRRRLARSSVLLCLFACLHNWSNFCSLKTYKCVSIRGFATRRNRQLLCGPELLLLLCCCFINRWLTQC